MSVEVGESSLTSFCGFLFSSGILIFLGGACAWKLFFMAPDKLLLLSPAFGEVSLPRVPFLSKGETLPMAMVLVGDCAVHGSL